MDERRQARAEHPRPSPAGNEAGGELRTGEEPPPTIPVVRRRPYGQWSLAALAALGTLAVAVSVYRNPNIHHPTIAEFITSAPILDGLRTTLELTALASLLGVVLGVFVALMRSSNNLVLTSLAWAYVWFFRGVPLLVQIIFWGNIALFFREVAIGIPFTDIEFFRAHTSTVITTFVAGVLGLGLHQSAYMAEIVRGGILSIDRGQTQAAQSLGMTRGQTMRRIVLPQALRVIIPPTGNEFINLLKASALVAVIAGGDLLTRSLNIAAVNFRTLELLAVATFWYMVIVSVASIGQYFLERRFGRGYTP